jgi:hypothetical protein
MLQALKTRISNLPNVKKFLQPGSQRKPPTNEKNVEESKEIFPLSKVAMHTKPMSTNLLNFATRKISWQL